jgi:hypothetical protein
MPIYVFKYSQAKDIRLYASDPVQMHGKQQPSMAMLANKRFTCEGGQWIEWLETSTSFGACFALATFWIIKKAKGEDFLDWLKPGSRACEDVGPNVNPGAGQMVADIKEMQLSQRGKEYPGQKLYDAMERVRRATGLVVRDFAEVKTGEIKEKEGFSLIVIKGQRKNPNAQDFGGQGGFNHAIATQVIDKDNVLLFDPNRGEIQLGCVGEANAFIKWLCMDPKQYNLKSYNLEWSAAASHRIKKGTFN